MPQNPEEQQAQQEKAQAAEQQRQVGRRCNLDPPGLESTSHGFNKSSHPNAKEREARVRSFNFEPWFSELAPLQPDDDRLHPRSQGARET